MKRSVYLFLTALMICTVLIGCDFNKTKTDTTPSESADAAVDMEPDGSDLDTTDDTATTDAGEPTNTRHQLTDASLADDNDDRGVMTASKGTNNRSNLMFDGKKGIDNTTTAIRSTTEDAAYQVKKTASQAKTAARSAGNRLKSLDSAQYGAMRTPMNYSIPGDPVTIGLADRAQTQRLPVFKQASYEQMLRNARVHDSDGFLGDHENATTPGIRL